MTRIVRFMPCRYVCGFLLVFLRMIPCSADVFDYEALMKLIKSEKVGSIEELIPHLPLSYKSRFVLIYQSRSLQFASLQAPRVLLYGRSEPTDADKDRLIMTYQVDDRAQKTPHSHQSLEIFEWFPDTKTYLPRRVDFGGVPLPGRANYREGDTKVCSKCHGTPLRLLWTAYPFWPGVYGSGLYPRDRYSYDQQEEIRKREHEAIRDLKNRWAQDPRLAPLNVKSIPDDLEGDVFEWTLGLSGKIQDQNIARMMNILKASPDYEKYKWAILASRDCSSKYFSRFFEAAELSDLFKGVTAAVEKVQYLKQGFQPDCASCLEEHTRKWTQRSVKFIDHLETAQVATWLRLIFEGRGMGSLLHNMLGHPPLNQINYSYDLTGFGRRLPSVIDELKALEIPGQKMDCKLGRPVPQ